jgi:hypothetical protein
MTNPTSNFGWQMPEPTDLVTNLPADFEVFGQAVDSDFADLLGGTTGQVLKKNTNADLDFVWGADSAGMTNPMTTTGDIIYSSPGSTPVRLGIGSASQVLTVASGVPSWATPAGGGGGKVLQVVQDTQVGLVSTTSSSYQATGLSRTITPSANTSKVLVMVSLNGVTKPSSTNNSSGVVIQARRDTTEIVFAGDMAGFTNSLLYNSIGSVSFSYLDSPATTSSTTYDVRFSNYISGQTAYINSYIASDTITSTIILMEIGA